MNILPNQSRRVTKEFEMVSQICLFIILTLSICGLIGKLCV